MKEIYAWVPWFQELARKIAEGGEDALIERAKQVDWQGKPSLLKGDDKNIDPFSFIYTLASKAAAKKRNLVYKSVSEKFDINYDLLLSEDSKNHGFYFPIPPPIGAVFFKDNDSSRPDLLWKLFRQVVQKGKIESDDFFKVLEVKGVGVINLTQCLFLIDPLRFLPIDDPILWCHADIGLPTFKEAYWQIKDEDNGLKNYQSMLEKFQAVFPECAFYEINTVLYRMNKRKKDGEPICRKIFQVSTDVLNDGKDEGSNFLENSHVYTGGLGQTPFPLTEPQAGDVVLVRHGNETGYAVGIVFHNDYAKGLSEKSEDNKKMRIRVSWLNKNKVDNLRLTGRPPGFCSAHEHGVYEQFKKNEGYKDTLAFLEKIQDTDDVAPHTDKGDNQMKHPHPLNQILYGPPGTGKTWNTVNHALAIIEGKPVAEIESEERIETKQRFDNLKDTGQIEMVTFHQSFAYEDFIEGIKPILGDESSNLNYEIVDGVFKRIAARANENLAKPNRNKEGIDLDALLEEFSADIEWKLEEEQKILFRKSNSKSDIEIVAINRKEGKFKSITIRRPTKKRGYRLARQVIERDYIRFCDDEIKTHHDIGPRWQVKLKKHSQSRSYFTLYERIKEFQGTWHSNELPSEQAADKVINYVLIIDEINRGNIAKIFGELITLIEDTKRIGNKDETTVVLPYSSNSDEDDNFGVPNNLYIIGTMNTADRSIALLDTALRRRFDFIEMMPKPEIPLINDNVEGVNCRKLLKVMNKRITVLLDREHQIGHSYFFRVDSMERLSHVFQHRIIPLLQEYFYDDWAKIDLVLNNNKLVTLVEIEDGLFSDKDLVDTERSIYELIQAESAEWTNAENYKKIYA